MKIKNVFLTNHAKILSLGYVLILGWWLVLYLYKLTDTEYNYWFGFAFACMPFFSGVYGILLSKKWGRAHSSIGRGILFLALGLISWGLGSFIFAYYNLVLKIAIPYPSLADLSYIVSWPFWAIGMVNLSKATGIQFQLRRLSGKAVLFVIPVFVVVVSYYLLFVFARGGLFDFQDSSGVKIFFDLFYPIGDVVILTLSLLIYGLSFAYLGGKYKLPILLLLLGFVLNYISDLSFSYTTTVESFYVGSWVDLLFSLTMYCLSLGLLGFNTSILNQKGQ